MLILCVVRSWQRVVRHLPHVSKSAMRDQIRYLLLHLMILRAVCSWCRHVWPVATHLEQCNSGGGVLCQQPLRVCAHTRACAVPCQTTQISSWSGRYEFNLFRVCLRTFCAVPCQETQKRSSKTRLAFGHLSQVNDFFALHVNAAMCVCFPAFGCRSDLFWLKSFRPFQS